MPQFMLFMLDREENLAGWNEMTPEEKQQGIQQYADWSERLAARGKLLGGEKLRDGSGRVVRSHDGELRVLDGPFSETKELIGGYFLISAADYDEAVELVSDCPHLDHGGTIEIREIELMPSALPGG